MGPRTNAALLLLVMLLACFAVSSQAALLPTDAGAPPPADPPSDEVHACFAAKDSMEKCLALPQCVWCLAMRKGNQCAHPHERIFKQNYEPKFKSHIDDMCASHTNAHEVLQKAKTAFDHSFQLTAGLDLKAVPSTRRFFGARLMVAVTTATFTYLYELSSGSSNANKLAIKGGQGSDIAITTAGFWLPVGGFGGSASDKCQLTSTVCDAAFLATGMLYKPQSDEQGSDPAAMEKLRQGGVTPPHLKIKKEKKDKKAKPFSNHLLMPILERFSNIEQLQISIILSSFCETIFQGVTGLSQVCIDEWRGKCIGASNAWAVFRQHKRLAALPPTPKELVNAVDIAVKTPYHMTHSDVETMAIVNRLHHEKPIFGYAGNKFGDLAGALVGYKSCKVPDYVDHFLGKK